MLVHLTLPTEILTRFDSILSKNADLGIQLAAMKFLSLVLGRIQHALTMINNASLVCNRVTTTEAYQQAILRFLPKPDQLFDSINASDELVGEYLQLLSLYSSSCFMSISAMNINLDGLLSSSILHLLTSFKDTSKNSVESIEKYFQCLSNIVEHREATDDVVWARHNKELGCTPIRMLLKLGQRSERLSSIVRKFSSMLYPFGDELNIWFYTWSKLGAKEEIEELLSRTIEKIILNPYPLLEKSSKDEGYSLLIFAALESNDTRSPSVDEYLSDVLFQISIGHSPQRSTAKLQSYLKAHQLLRVDRIAQLEKDLLAPIDLTLGPEPMQIHLALKLNLYKLFSLHHRDQRRLIAEMIQCLNIAHRSFVRLFDQTLTWIECYSSTIEENRRLSLICQLIEGFDVSHQSNEQSLEHSQVLLQCLRFQPTNDRLIDFAGNYLSLVHRKEFLELICQSTTVTRPMVKIVLREIQHNRTLADGRIFDVLVDSFPALTEELDEALRCALELIERMKRNGNKDWKTTLRLKQKLVWKLGHEDSPLRVKFVVRTLTALRSGDRPDAVRRLLKKSSRSLLLLAGVFHSYLLGGETIE